MDTQPKLLITGSRRASRAMLAYASRLVDRAHQQGWSIIVGDADGVDTAVIERCDALGVSVEVHGGKGKMRRTTKTGTNIAHPEGFLDRDAIMARECTCCAAVWNGHSRGTRFTFDAVKALGKQTWVVDFSKPEGQRLVTSNAVSAETGGPTGSPNADPSSGERRDA